jgi:tryptophan synthase alpha subunit
MVASRAGVTSVPEKTAWGDTAAYLAVHWKQWQVLRKLQDYGVVLDAQALGILQAYVAEGYVSGSELEDIMERQLQLQIPS